MQRSWVPVLATVGVGWLLSLGGARAAEAPLTPGSDVPEARAAAWAGASSRSLTFEPNLGQFDRRVRYAGRGHGETVFITRDGAVITRGGRGPDSKRLALRLRFPGARHDARIEAVDPLPGRSNYLIGNDRKRWRTDVPRYARVLVHDAYPGIDIAYYDGGAGIEYDLVVAPGADPSQVRLVVDGAERIELAPDGDLVLHTELGEVRQRKPVVYQGERSAASLLAGGYRLHPGRHGTEVRFEPGAYDHTRALVLDPVLGFSTFFGGAAADDIKGLAVDGSGDIYVAGYTQSAAATFPETAGAYQTAKAAFVDGFVAKIKGDGSQLLYATYIGGNGNDFVNAIAVDANGQAVIGGNTDSTNYPTQSSNQTMTTASCGVVTKLNAGGTGLVFSTYLCGAQSASVNGVASDASLNTYVTGRSFDAIPTTIGAFQTTFAGNANAFVVKYASNGSRVYATLIGSSFEGGNGIALDSSGNAYVVGTMIASAINGVTATLIGPGGPGDVMLAKVNPTGSGLAYLTRIGGSDAEDGLGIAVDSAGVAYFTGSSYKQSSPDLPSVPPAPADITVALFGALNAAGTALTGPGLTWYGDSTAWDHVACPSFGGAIGTAIALVPGANSAYVVGYGCPATKFPVVNPITGLDCTPNCASASGSFLLKYSWSGSPPPAQAGSKALLDNTLDSATPVTGGAGTNTQATAVRPDAFGNLLASMISDGSPPTKNAIDASANGGDDGVVVGARYKLPPQIQKQFEPDTIEKGGSTILALIVSNPNPDLTLTQVGINDTLNVGLQALGDGKFQIVSDTPPGCNNTLGLFSWSRYFAGLISNEFSYGPPEGAYPIETVSGPDLPPNFVCTVRFRVAEIDLALPSYLNTTAKPTSANAGTGDEASAVLNITTPTPFTWSGLGADNKFNNPNNWATLTVPAAGSQVVLPAGAPQKSIFNDLSQGYLFNRFEVADSGYSVSGNKVQLHLQLNIKNNAVFSNGLGLDDKAVLHADAGANATISGDITLPGAGFKVFVSNDGGMTFPGSFTGSGSIVFDGPGATILNGSAASGSNGNLVVGDGNVEIDGNYQPWPLSIGLGGTAGGTGSVGPVDSDGLLKIGTVPTPYGTFNVGGNYQSAPDGGGLELSAQSQVMRPSAALDAAALGISGKLMVSGSAALGGTLLVDFDAPPAVGDSYVLVSANGISGQFRRSRASPSSVFGEVSYTGSTVTYTVTGTSGIFRDGFE